MEETGSNQESTNELTKSGPKPVIRFEDVSKRFIYNVERQQTLLESVISTFSRKSENKADLWAVCDVSFAVNSGQCLGIVGRNGSGKSTILLGYQTMLGSKVGCLGRNRV